MGVSEKGDHNLGPKRKRPRLDWLVARVHIILRLGPRQWAINDKKQTPGLRRVAFAIAYRKTQMPALAASEMGWEVSLIGLGHGATVPRTSRPGPDVDVD